MRTRSLTELMDIHKDLDELFARHRDLVVGLEFAAARDALVEFERRLRRHMDDEETLILPLYRERVGHVLGGDPEFFDLEHRNLLKNLAELKAAADALAADSAAGRRQAHEFLAKESMFMHLLDHHDRRERSTLYPELDRRLTDAEREDLLRRCLGS